MNPVMRFRSFKGVVKEIKICITSWLRHIPIDQRIFLLLDIVTCLYKLAGRDSTGARSQGHHIISRKFLDLTHVSYKLRYIQ